MLTQNGAHIAGLEQSKLAPALAIWVKCIIPFLTLYVHADLVKPVLAAPSVQGIKLFMTAPLQGNSRCGDPRILQKFA